MSEPKINVSLKLDGNKPWVTVYGDNAAELAAHLDSIAANGIGPKAAAALASLMAGFEAGAQLGAEQVASYPVPQAAPAAPPAPEAQTDPWGAPQGAPPAWAGVQQPPAPAPQYAPPAPAYGAPAAAPAPAPAAAPGAVQGPYIPALQAYATFKQGNGAKGPWKAWLDPRPKAVLDALPKGPDGKVPSTNDPNDPRIAAGQAKFASFIR